jgi:hypothetical protein
MATWGAFPLIKQPRRKANHPSPPIDEFENVWSYIYTLPYTFITFTWTISPAGVGKYTDSHYLKYCYSILERRKWYHRLLPEQL